MIQQSPHSSSIHGSFGRRTKAISWVVALAGLSASVAEPRVASANSAAVNLHYTGREAGAFLARRTSLVVQHEELQFECGPDRCEFMATYHIRNATDVDESVIGAFYGIDTDRFGAIADGIDVRRALTEEEARAIDTVANLHPSMVPLDRLVREGFALRVEAQVNATLVFSGRIFPVLLGDAAVTDPGARQPLEVRHPWLGGHSRNDVVREYVYALSPILSWSGAPDIEVTVRCSSARAWATGQAGWTVRDGEEGLVARRLVAARDAGDLHFRVVATPGTTVQHGGPLVGVGARWGAGELRGRLGYELAFPWWMVESVSVETNFKDDATIVPLVELASPYYGALLPSFAFGVGAPVQIRSGSGAFVGVRGQLTMSFPVLSLVAPFDVFPALPGDPFQASLLAQASF